MHPALKPLSWIAGIAGVVGVFAYVGPSNLPQMMRAVGFSGVLAWAAITLLARVILVETTTAPLRALGFNLRRSDAFWVGWLRTFANQIFPAAGVVAYTQAIRSKVGISWAEIAALAAPQFVLVAAALGVVGLAALYFNLEALQGISIVALAAIYGGVLLAALLISHGAHSVITLLPKSISARIETTSEALRKFAARPTLVMLVVSCHVATILLRGLRMWLLFGAASVALDWREALLIVAVAESSMLIQLTPGGLGIREGAVIAGALLAGVPAEVAAGVALLDRLFVIAITTLLTPPAVVALRLTPTGKTRLQ